MQYFIYHLRWQLSSFVMFPIMWFFKNWVNDEFIRLSLGQLFGAVIFYMIDKRIFHLKEKKP